MNSTSRELRVAGCEWGQPRRNRRAFSGLACEALFARSGARASQARPLNVCAGSVQPATRNPQPATAFTLTEILIVIGLIVLILVLAVPALDFITGSNSIDAAQNQISAMLGRARTEAIGVQEPVGVMFYLNEDRIQMVLVEEASHPIASGAAAQTYLDLVADRDATQLPVGVALQLVDDAFVTGAGVRTDDGYIGYNDLGGGVKVGGVILFDAFGRLYHTSCGFLTQTTDALGNKVTSRMGDLINVNTSGLTDYFDPPSMTSNFGFVLAQYSPLKNLFGSTVDADPQIAGDPYSTAEENEEKWLDENALPVLVNRYNGTLVKGE